MTFGDLSDDTVGSTMNNYKPKEPQPYKPQPSSSLQKAIHQSVIKEEELEESGILSDCLTYSMQSNVMSKMSH